MRRYYAMAVDELGEEFRYNDQTYTFPDFDEEDEVAYDGFLAWKRAIVYALNKNEDRELRIYLDRDDHEKYGGFNNAWFEG